MPLLLFFPTICAKRRVYKQIARSIYTIVRDIYIVLSQRLLVEAVNWAGR